MLADMGIETGTRHFPACWQLPREGSHNGSKGDAFHGAGFARPDLPKTMPASGPGRSTLEFIMRRRHPPFPSTGRRVHRIHAQWVMGPTCGAP